MKTCFWVFSCKIIDNTITKYTGHERWIDTIMNFHFPDETKIPELFIFRQRKSVYPTLKKVKFQSVKYLL